MKTQFTRLKDLCPLGFWYYAARAAYAVSCAIPIGWATDESGISSHPVWMIVFVLLYVIKDFSAPVLSWLLLIIRGVYIPFVIFRLGGIIAYYMLIYGVYPKIANATGAVEEPPPAVHLWAPLQLALLLLKLGFGLALHYVLVLLVPSAA